MPKRKRWIKTVLHDNFIREHLVPTAVLLPLVIKALKEERDPRAYVSLLIKECCHVAYVADTEDSKLTKAGLGKRMPQNWAFDPSRTPLDRYEAVGIDLAPTWPEDCSPDLRGRPAEMDYAKVEWDEGQVADEIIKLWRAGLEKPCTPIRAILVGFPHSKNMIRMSRACENLWNAATI